MDPRLLELVAAARAVQGAFPLPKGLDAGSVAAAVRSATGKIYTGICLDLNCGIGFCAEHAAVAEMLKQRETRVLAVVAVAASALSRPAGGAGSCSCRSTRATPAVT